MNEFMKLGTSGEIDKQAYIKEMYETYHSKLFEYAQNLGKTNIKRIEIEDGNVLITSRDRGVRLICPPDDYRVTPIETFNFLDYEKNDSKMIENLFSDGDTFFDIGANIGWYSINIAFANRKSRIYSFEPIPHTYNYIKKNLSLNSTPNISTYNFGLSNKAGIFDFYYYSSGSGNASLENLSGRNDVQVVRCELKTLDSFILEEKTKVDFIKCDVEGAELLVFEGASNVIDRDKPVIFSEILRKWTKKFNYDPNQIFSFLHQKGYRSFVARGDTLDEFSAMTEDTIETNFFFLHGDKHQEKIERFKKNL